MSIDTKAAKHDTKVNKRHADIHTLNKNTHSSKRLAFFRPKQPPLASADQYRIFDTPEFSHSVEHEEDRYFERQESGYRVVDVVPRTGTGTRTVERSRYKPIRSIGSRQRF